MPKIIVPIEPVDTSGGIEAPTPEGLAAIAENASASSANAANVVRDAQGKVVQIEINLPDVDASGLETAAMAIAANNGVAGGRDGMTTMPLNITDGVESFEDEANGVVVDSIGDESSMDSFSLGGPTTFGVLLNNEASSDQSTEGALSLRYKVDPAVPPTADGSGQTTETHGHSLQYLNPTTAYDALKASFKVRFATDRDVTGGQPGTPVALPKSRYVEEAWFFVFGSAQIVFSMGSAASTNFHNSGELNAIVAGGFGGSITLQGTPDLSPDLPLDEWITVNLEYSTGGKVLEAVLTWNGGANSATISYKKSEINATVLQPMTSRFTNEFMVIHNRIESGLTPNVPAPVKVHGDCYQDEISIDLTNVLIL